MERGAEGGVVHRGHEQLAEGTTRRGGARQSRCHPALQVSRRSIFPSSKGLWQTWQCVSSKKTEGGCQWMGRGVAPREIGIGGSGLEAAERSGSMGGLFVRPIPSRAVF